MGVNKVKVTKKNIESLETILEASGKLADSAQLLLDSVGGINIAKAIVQMEQNLKEYEKKLFHCKLDKNEDDKKHTQLVKKS